MNKINITMMHVLNNSNYKKIQISQLDCIYNFNKESNLMKCLCHDYATHDDLVNVRGWKFPRLK